MINSKLIPVAVKTQNSAANPDDLQRFLMELKVMIYIGDHENILKLVAACTSNTGNEMK